MPVFRWLCRLSLSICLAVPVWVRADPLAGEVLSERTLRVFKADALAAKLGDRVRSVGQPRCDVRLIEITYRTRGVHDEPADASAMLLLPEGPHCQEPKALLGWARGTETRRASAQAEAVARAGSSPLIELYAAQGYAVAATDYLGLGHSSYPFHPYLHAATEATAVIDSLRAARRVMAREGVALSGQVMLAGYSQGGHATLAAQRTLEQRYAKEFNLVASAPMSGPYALSQTFLDNWPGRTPAGANVLAPYLFSYTLVAMQRVYGNLYQRPDELLRQPWATRVERLLPGPDNVFKLLREQALPASNHLDRLRQPAFTREFMENPEQPFRVALRRNDLLDWTPRTPTLLCGASRDTVVEFRNARSAFQAFRARGAPVRLLDVDERLPSGLDGLQIHTQAAAAACMLATRQNLLDPERH
ncbi:lipase family protein [Pseudomonas oryzihabitans]|uniref:alpha/beta hydrolase n=1 Tax=Pseudomonas oryzihabitans TaxID=47885 RepID=UPI002894553D|nr:lipase family protein [Pseudomonas oryzihabitans]MDT3720154.1 lipase family protein [Pseudomonas oryzihabitans]